MPVTGPAALDFEKRGVMGITNAELEKEIRGLSPMLRAFIHSTVNELEAADKYNCEAALVIGYLVYELGGEKTIDWTAATSIRKAFYPEVLQILSEEDSKTVIRMKPRKQPYQEGDKCDIRNGLR